MYEKVGNILKTAKESNTAAIAFICMDYVMARTVVYAAEATNTPAIVMLFPEHVTIQHTTGFEKYAAMVKELAGEAGLDFPFEPLEDHQIIKVSHLHLMSLLTDQSNVTVTIAGKNYRQVEDTSIPYLGYLQEPMSFYVVNDREYGRLKPFGEELHTYNYRIKDSGNFVQTRDRLDRFVAGLEGDDTARIAIDPESNELDWIKVMYSICVFMFFVFVLASGSIMFMKLYNDAFEEKGRYQEWRMHSFKAGLRR